MASKGQKFKKYSSELKNKILKEYLDGLGGECSLAKKYGITRGTIENWIRKFENGIDVRTDHRKDRSGRPKAKNLTLEDYKERYEILKNTRPSYKRDERKSNVYNHPYKRLQAI